MFSSFFIFIIGLLVLIKWPEAFVAMFFVGQFLIQGMLGGNVSRTNFGYTNFILFGIFVVLGILILQSKEKLLGDNTECKYASALTIAPHQINYLFVFLAFVAYAVTYYLMFRLNRFALIQLLTLFYMLPVIYVLSLLKPSFSLSRFAGAIIVLVLIRIMVLSVTEGTSGAVDLQIGYRNISAQLLGMNFDGGIWLGRFVGLLLVSLLFFIDRGKIPHLIILPFVLILVATGSRGPLVAFIITYMFWSYTRKKTETVLLLIPVLVVGIAFLIYKGNEAAVLNRYSLESEQTEE